MTPGSARDVPVAAVREHMEEERCEVGRLGRVREVVFGAQDGLVSTLGVVAAVSAATDDRVTVLIAGLASALAGIFSMAVGEYLGSRSEDRVMDAVVEDEVEEVRTRPLEAEAEVAVTYLDEGMEESDAYLVAEIIARNPDSLVSTMIARELGLVVSAHDTSASAVSAAGTMGLSFAVGAVFPLLPFLVGGGLGALLVSAALTGVALFMLGARTAMLASAPWLRSGLETLGLAAAAGLAGYLFGTVLPALVGVAGVS